MGINAEDLANALDKDGKVRSRMDPLNHFTELQVDLISLTIEALQEKGMNGAIAAQLVAFEIFDSGFSMLIGLGIPYDQVTDCIELVRQRADINALRERGTLTDAERTQMLAELVLPYLKKHGA